MGECRVPVVDVAAFTRAMRALSRASESATRAMRRLTQALRPAPRARLHVDIDRAFPGHYVNQTDDAWPFSHAT